MAHAVDKPGERILYADLEVDSAFNTYRRPGLPPGFNVYAPVSEARAAKAKAAADVVLAEFAEAGIEPSVGSKGDSYDNALAETINGLYKAELIHRRGPWKTRESVELATLEWVSWFNHQRLMEPLGYIPPAEAEANYYRQHNREAAVAA